MKLKCIAVDDEPLALLTVLESNGFDDMIWCLRVKSLARLNRHFQAWCAEQVLHIFEAASPNDMRVRNQINMLRNDSASNAERDAACADAWTASRDVVSNAAADAARAAVSTFAWVAMTEAAWAAAGAAVSDVNWNVNMSAEMDVVWGAACADTRAAQRHYLQTMIKGHK